MLKALFSNNVGCHIDHITELHDEFFQLEDFTDETRQQAKENGFKYAHAFKEKETDDSIVYVYVATFNA